MLPRKVHWRSRELRHCRSTHTLWHQSIQSERHNVLSIAAEADKTNDEALQLKRDHEWRRLNGHLKTEKIITVVIKGLISLQTKSSEPGARRSSDFRPLPNNRPSTSLHFTWHIQGVTTTPSKPLYAPFPKPSSSKLDALSLKARITYDNKLGQNRNITPRTMKSLIHRRSDA